MPDLDRALSDLAERTNWITDVLGLSPEEAEKFRAETASKMQDAIEKGFREGERKYALWSEWEKAHPDATYAETLAFRRTLWPEEVAWEEWQEEHPTASREDAAYAYEEIYGFEPDEEDVEDFEPDPFLRDLS